MTTKQFWIRSQQPGIITKDAGNEIAAQLQPSDLCVVVTALKCGIERVVRLAVATTLSTDHGFAAILAADNGQGYIWLTWAYLEALQESAITIGRETVRRELANGLYDWVCLGHVPTDRQERLISRLEELIFLETDRQIMEVLADTVSRLCEPPTFILPGQIDLAAA